jgi:UDP-N-acetylmuramoyl-tripeptide--D-alanyl-D-alanine ligase
MRLRLAEVQEVCGGRLIACSPASLATSYHTDSRQVQAGGLFFALRGAELDGHAFVADAAAREPAAVVVEHELAADVPQLVVPDTWRALYDLAAGVLRRVSPLVVGVTGSNGKTSTRELTAAVLGSRHRVHRTPANLNTETGLPLTILELEPEHTAAVLEMGMRGPGEIAQLAALARPTIGIVTSIGTVHVEFFADGQEGIARAKGELLAALPPGGQAVVNADEPRFLDLLRGLSQAPSTTFGLDAGDLRGTNYRPLAEGGGTFEVDGVEVRLALGGRHQARNALAALAAGRFAGVPLADGARALAGVQTAHRLEPHTTPGGWTVIDDAYNASPESMAAAFETASQMSRTGRLLALLGEMRELGQLAEAAHRRTGAYARDVFDRVAVVDVGWGPTLAEAAGGELVRDLAEGAEWVRREARPGDVVLVKASHGVALDRVVDELLGAERAR